LDLLPIVRRLFRHRMPDARLRTAESELLGLQRVGDIDGWEIPGRYLEFLRGGPADPLVDIVRHNDQDVRSLARLLAHLEGRLADPLRRSEAPPGDLAGLARAFARERRLGEALACLDAAADRIVDVTPPRATAAGGRNRIALGDEPWWSPRRHADFGGRPPARPIPSGVARRTGRCALTAERIAIDRAHLLRRIDGMPTRPIWSALAAGPGRIAIVATIELAKLHEHRLGDRPAALAAAQRGLGMVERRLHLGRPEPALEADLLRRLTRLRRRLGRVAARPSPRGVP
jgi:hypothetical protein